MPQLVKQGVRTCKSGQLLLSGVCAFPKAVDQAQLDRNAKNAAYAVPNQVREQVKAKNKQTAPVAPSVGWWDSFRGIADSPWSPVGILQRLGIGATAKKTPEELRADPLSPAEHVAGAIGSVGKWAVVGLVAIAAIVVVPRILKLR